MAAALVFMAGNNYTYKEGQNVCGKASKFSQLEEASIYRAYYGNQIDLINDWASQAFGELQPWVGQCIRYDNQVSDFNDLNQRYAVGNVIQ